MRSSQLRRRSPGASLYGKFRPDYQRYYDGTNERAWDGSTRPESCAWNCHHYDERGANHWKRCRGDAGRRIRLHHEAVWSTTRPGRCRARAWTPRTASGQTSWWGLSERTDRATDNRTSSNSEFAWRLLQNGTQSSGRCSWDARYGYTRTLRARRQL